MRLVEGYGTAETQHAIEEESGNAHASGTARPSPSRPSSLFTSNVRSATSITLLSPVNGEPVVSVFSPSEGPSVVMLHSGFFDFMSPSSNGPPPTTIISPAVAVNLPHSIATASSNEEEMTINFNQLNDILQSDTFQLGLTSPVASCSTARADIEEEAEAPAPPAKRSRGRPRRNPVPVPLTQQPTTIHQPATVPPQPRKRKSDVDMADLQLPATKRRVGRSRGTRDPSKWATTTKYFVKKPQTEKNLSIVILIRRPATVLTFLFI